MLRPIPVWSYNDNTKNVNIFPSLERSNSLVLLCGFFCLLVSFRHTKNGPNNIEWPSKIFPNPQWWLTSYLWSSGWRDSCCKPCRGFFAFISLLRFMFYCEDNCICVLLSWLHRYGLSHSGRQRGNLTACHWAGKITQGHMPFEAAGFCSSSYLFFSPALIPPVLHSHFNLCGTLPVRSS